METIGIICEFNPLHNGHVYFLDSIKRRYPESRIVLVMSGYFTERGDASILSKYDKVKLSLLYGVDLVLELPVLYTLNSADFFAEAAIKILSMAHVTRIVFGSETDDVTRLLEVAKIQLNDSKINVDIKSALSEGLNYPSALSKVLGETFDSNDILGIAYIKAILNGNYDISFETVKRTNSFNDLELDDNIVSAENIRYKIYNDDNIDKYIPNYNGIQLVKVDNNKMFELLKYKIITSKRLDCYLGVDEGLENRIKDVIKTANGLNELIEMTKSKRYTYVRIKRMFTHILLGIEKEDMAYNIDYARVLGFTSSGQKLLKELNSEKLVYRYIGRVRDIELVANGVYEMITGKCENEEKGNKPIKIDR